MQFENYLQLGATQDSEFFIKHVSFYLKFILNLIILYLWKEYKKKLIGRIRNNINIPGQIVSCQ